MLLSRRSFVQAVAAAIASSLVTEQGATAASITSSNRFIFPDNTIPFYLQLLISYGQSWGGNSFDSFASPFSFSPQAGTLITCHLNASALGGPPEACPPSLGVSTPGTVDGLTSYATTDPFTIGRCSVLARQLLRLRLGLPLIPILEVNFSWPGSTWTSGGGGGLGPNIALFTGGITTPGTLVVSAMTSGTILEGQAVFGTDNTFYGQISFSGSGSGGTGSYGLSTNTTVGAGTTLSSIGLSWQHMQKILAEIFAVLPKDKVLGITTTIVEYTQGGSVIDTVAAKVADLTDGMNQYNGLGLPGGGIKFFPGISAPVSNSILLAQSAWGTYKFCRDNVQGGGGPFAGAVYGVTPWYQWPFNGADNIHTNDYGSAREGEKHGQVECDVLDRSIAWTPLWRSLTRPISIVGSAIKIPFDKPPGSDWSGPLTWRSDANDGIKVWPQYGFHTSRAGVDHALASDPVIDGSDVYITPTIAPLSGDLVDYAFNGPGGPNPGPCSGVGGNLCVRGPASVLFPGNTIDDFGWPSQEAIP